MLHTDLSVNALPQDLSPSLVRMTQVQTLRLGWVAMLTLIGQEVRRFMRIWPQTLVPPVISMSLYFLIFGAFIGSRIGEMDGLAYMEFIVPGLVMMSVMTNSYANVASSFYSRKFQRSIETLLVSPIPDWAILGGFIIGGVVRGLITAAIVVMVASGFADLSVHNGWAIVGVLLLTTALFSLGGFINGMLADKFDDVSIIPTFVLTPLTYLGGVFYSLDLLPPFWRDVSYLNPVVYIVSSFRYGFFGYNNNISVLLSFAIITFFVLALWFLCMWLLRRGTRLRM